MGSTFHKLCSRFSEPLKFTAYIAACYICRFTTEGQAFFFQFLLHMSVQDWGSSREDLEQKRLEKLLKVNTKSKKSLFGSVVADVLEELSCIFCGCVFKS